MDTSNLVVWLPFDESTTKDLCGGTWTAANGSFVSADNAISGNAFQNTAWRGMDVPMLKRTGGLTLGGQDFTIRCWFNQTGTSNMNPGCRLFGLYSTDGSSDTYLKRDCRGRYIQLFSFDKSTATIPIELGVTYFYEVDYTHNDGVIRLFLDGVLVGTLEQTIERAAYPSFGMGYHHWSSDTPIGTFDEFQVFDGVALHTANFALPTAEEYVQTKWESFGYQMIAYDFDVSRRLVQSVTCDFNVERMLMNEALEVEADERAGINLIALEDLDSSQSRTGSAFYQTELTKCFNLPPMQEVFMEFDVYFDGTKRWRAGNIGSVGLCGLVANPDTALDFYSNYNLVLNQADTCPAHTLQTIRLHMLAGSDDGIIEAWVDNNFIYRYTGDVNNGAPFEDLFLQSDGATTFFSSFYVSSYGFPSRQYRKFDFDAVRQVLNAQSTWSTTSSTVTIWAPPGGKHNPNYITVTTTSGTRSFYQTEITKVFDLPPTYDIWIDFDVYFDGVNLWRAGNVGSAGICGLVASADTSLAYLSNGREVFSRENVCWVNEVQPILLHMTSGKNNGVIECWANGDLIYKYVGNVNGGAAFNDIFLQCDGAGTLFSNVTFSTDQMDPRSYSPTINLCIFHNGQVLSLPFRQTDSPITPALAIFHDAQIYYCPLAGQQLLGFRI